MQNNNKYAKTLFDLCSKHNCVGMVQNQLRAIAYLFNKTSAFRLVLITKRLDNQTKINVVKNALPMFEPLIIEFISIIIKNNLSNGLIDIISRFNRLASMNSDIKNIDITTANKLSNEELQSLSESISSILNAKPKINIKEDSDMIGGIKLRVGNKIFDNSVSYQINQLKKTLHNM